MTHATLDSQRRRAFVALVTLLGLARGVAGAASLHVDDFQAPGTSGWTGGAFGGEVTGRNPDGGPGGVGDAFLQLQTIASNLATHNSLPVWSGDYAGIGAARISVDLRNAVGSDPLAMRIVLFGPASTSIRWTSTVPAEVPPDGVWRTYQFSLASDALTRVVGAAAYEALMQSVFQVMLRHDPDAPSSGGTPVTATLGIDNVRLAVAPAVGDYDGDGDVDPDDYHAWSDSYGATASGGADGNGDGVVDSADYTIWRDAFGAAPVSIPEPPSLAVALGTLAFLASFSRFRTLAEHGC